MERFSNWHITVNFNKDTPDLIYKMREAIEALPQPEFLWRWLRWYHDRRQEEFPDDEAAKVHGVRLRAAFEHKGEHNKALHVHILLEVAHSTSVQINKKSFCEIWREIVGLNPNVRIDFVKGSGEDKDFILHYMTKEVPRYQPTQERNQRMQKAFAPSSGNTVVVEEVNL